MTKWTKEVAEKIFDAIPEANAVAVDLNNSAFWYAKVPRLNDYTGVDWENGHNNTMAFVGQFECDNWKESLYVKRWKPEIGEKCYNINTYMIVEIFDWENNSIDNLLFESNNCFRTQEEAEKKRDKIIEILNE